MSLGKIMEIYQFFWMFESHAQQRLAWEDAAQARIARVRAEAQAAAQLQAMLDRTPAGGLWHAARKDEAALGQSGLLALVSFWIRRRGGCGAALTSVFSAASR